MKTLILTGSPRKKGHTAELTEYLAARLDGEVEILSLDHRTDIMPCRDCRYCFTHRACCIQDPMQEIYQKLDEADRILFAAPVYFYNIPVLQIETLLSRPGNWRHHTESSIHGDRR